jgi:hypothetical protein
LYGSEAKAVLALRADTFTMLIATEHLTRIDKLRIIEQLWQELSASPEQAEPPHWHANVLKESEEAIASGEATFEDWKQVKLRLRQGSAPRSRKRLLCTSII